MAAPLALPNQIRSTAGAVPVVNEKGELTMQKVKVNRYVSGRRPDYAPESSDSESSEEEEEFVTTQEAVGGPVVEERRKGEEERGEDQVEDRRLRRLRERHAGRREEKERQRRPIEEPEVIYEAGDELEAEEEFEEGRGEEVREKVYQRIPLPSDSESEDEELDDETIEKRREMMRERARQKALEEDILDVVEEEASAEGESSEYEEYTDSEDETGPRLKPVFVRKMDRVTIREKEAQEKEEEELEKDKKRQFELRKKESHRLVATAIAAELQQEQGAVSVEKVVNTDDENDEEEYEAWKLRELKRIKREREKKEQEERVREELEKMRNMTEEERRAELKNNPHFITNKANKGKYKFLQKYYHRGAFYLEDEENVLKRDVTQATLEDHFDKTVLPKVMQVKNFGRAGRTKYTHLVDQDTTVFDSPWSQTNPINVQYQNRGGGTKQFFEKPSTKKRKLG